MAAGDVLTYPHCGACGYNVAEYNVNGDQFCDSCGADVTDYGIAKATNAVAGTPGEWDGLAPSTLAQVLSDVGPPAPATAWTTGQGIWLGDRSTQIHWDGAAWVVGVAP